MRKTVFTTIHPFLKKRLLIRGTILGAAGAGLLLVFSTWSTETFLAKWGLLIFSFGIGSISLGMIPLRRIQRMESIPHSLSITEKELIYEKQGKSPLCLHKNEILKTKFLQRGDLYGIEVMTRSLQRFFFPYFSEKSADTLSEYIMHGEESNE